jgi:hypothetical protein
MIDLDAVEACHRCWQPVALIELAEWGTRRKSVTTMKAIAVRAGLPSFTVRYQFPDVPPTRLSVVDHTTGSSAVLDPDDYERFLLDLRNGHTCPGKR